MTTHDEAGVPAESEPMLELTEAEMAEVAGGLNPQPLPPRRLRD